MATTVTTPCRGIGFLVIGVIIMDGLEDHLLFLAQCEDVLKLASTTHADIPRGLAVLNDYTDHGTVAVWNVAVNANVYRS